MRIQDDAFFLFEVDGGFRNNYPKVAMVGSVGLVIFTSWFGFVSMDLLGKSTALMISASLFVLAGVMMVVVRKIDYRRGEVTALGVRGCWRGVSFLLTHIHEISCVFSFSICGLSAFSNLTIVSCRTF